MRSCRMEAKRHLTAISPQGARDLGQLRLGKASEVQDVDSSDPTENIWMGPRYLGRLWAKFGCGSTSDFSRVSSRFPPARPPSGSPASSRRLKPWFGRFATISSTMPRNRIPNWVWETGRRSLHRRRTNPAIVFRWPHLIHSGTAGGRAAVGADIITPWIFLPGRGPRSMP